MRLFLEWLLFFTIILTPKSYHDVSLIWDLQSKMAPILITGAARNS
jgi:hypothetical protein